MLEGDVVSQGSIIKIIEGKGNVIHSTLMCVFIPANTKF